jgi:hypothetical protein
MNEQGYTQEYEQKALATFKAWYQKSRPTIKEASQQAYVIARETVGGLTTTQVIHLLEEHSEWTHQHPQESFDSDKAGLSIGEIARRHLVKHLEHVIQRRGFQVVHTDAWG